MTTRTLRRRRQRRLSPFRLSSLPRSLWLQPWGCYGDKANAHARMPSLQPSAPRRSSCSHWVSSSWNGILVPRWPTLLASLEHADNPDVRRFALRVLWRGPTPFALARTDSAWAGPTGLTFSSDGGWLAGVNIRTGSARLWTSDGSARFLRPGALGTSPGGILAWTASSFVVTVSDSIRVHALDSGKEIRRINGTFRWGLVRGQSVVTGTLWSQRPTVARGA